MPKHSGEHIIKRLESSKLAVVLGLASSHGAPGPENFVLKKMMPHRGEGGIQYNAQFIVSTWRVRMYDEPIVVR